MVSNVVQRRLIIEESANKISDNTQYIFKRLTSFVQSSNLNTFKYNSGMFIKYYF